jgi:hypothetical protein
MKHVAHYKPPRSKPRQQPGPSTQKKNTTVRNYSRKRENEKLRIKTQEPPRHPSGDEPKMSIKPNFNGLLQGGPQHQSQIEVASYVKPRVPLLLRKTTSARHTKSQDSGDD